MGRDVRRSQVYTSGLWGIGHAQGRKNRPDLYELDKTRVEEIMPKKRQDEKDYGDYYTLINAWSDSWHTISESLSPETT